MPSDNDSAKNLDRHPSNTSDPVADTGSILNLEAKAPLNLTKTAIADPFSSRADHMGSQMSNLGTEAEVGTGVAPQQPATLSIQSAQSTQSAQQEDSLIKFNHVTYLLYTLSFFTAGLIWIVPIVMNYMRRREADNTWLATHFDWQIKTFWYSLVLGSIGTLIIVFSLSGLGISIFAKSGNIAIGSVLFIGLGVILLLIAVIWHFYRIIRGWIALADKRPIP